jgi:hypothetical protein
VLLLLQLYLGLRAYPDDRSVFELACSEAERFGARVRRLRRADAEAAEELEDTGLVETGMYYDYDYSGSGWLLGAPKDVGDLNIHATPVYEDASKVMASFQARF